MKLQVTEDDFRQPQFRGAKPEDYEFDGSGEIARKDRFVIAVHRLAGITGLSDKRIFDIEEVIQRCKLAVDFMMRFAGVEKQHYTCRPQPGRELSQYEVLDYEGTLVCVAAIRDAETIRDALNHLVATGRNK